MSIYVTPSGDDQTAAEGSTATAAATIKRAVELVTDGQSIYVLGGDYPGATITRQFTRPTVIRGSQARILEPLKFSRAANVTVMGLQCQAGVDIRTSAGISLTAGMRVTYPSQAAVYCRGSQRILLDSITVSGARRGFAMPGNVGDDSTGVTIRRCEFASFLEDAMVFGDLTGLEVSDNIIHDMYDPAGVLHNDGIQLFGNVSDVLIARNHISGSRSQGMLLQAAVGPNARMTVVDNTVENIGGVAVQFDAMPGTVIEGNSLSGKLGALWGWSRQIPNDVAVANNTLSAPWAVKSQPVNVVRDEGNVVAPAV